MSVFLTIVLDGVGVGALPDADAYGDMDSHTLDHVVERTDIRLLNLQRLGLGNIEGVTSIDPIDHPEASFGRMAEMTAGKDSTSGHWELAGLVLANPFPTYPQGFPDDLIRRFTSGCGVAAVIGNKTASGTEIIAESGDAHVETGHPIVYTSVDSVFQVAAHVDVIPLDTLYQWCEIARNEVMVGAHGVGRVIARPFTGESGAYRRLSEKRKDFSLRPTGSTLPLALQRSGVVTESIGKVNDLFAGEGFSSSSKTDGNAQGMQKTLEAVRQNRDESAFIWTNLVDFDQEFGHRNNPEGFAQALVEFDQWLPSLLDAMPDGSRLAITADHGNDPTTPGTDHSREFVPILLWGGEVRPLGTRSTFSAHAATVSDFFGVEVDFPGGSFLG